MTIPDTIFDTINDNWGAGGYAGVAPAIDTTETQTSHDMVTANVIEVRAQTLRERGEQKNDVYVNRHYTIDVYISTKTSAAQLTLLYDEVEYLLRNTAMTGIQLEHIDKDWSASEWEEGLHATVMRVAVVALLSDGAVTSAAGVTASMQALLMYGSANAAYVPCIFELETTAAKVYLEAGVTSITNADATDVNLRFGFPMPLVKGALKLYVTGARLVLTDADADDYVTAIAVFGAISTGQTTIFLDGTDRTAAGAYTYTCAATDVSAYTALFARVNCTCTTAAELDINSVDILCYYA